MTDETPRSKVKWEPPPPRPPQYDWAKIADQLRAKPMEWAKIFDRDRASVVVAIRAGNITPVRPDLGFESRTANNVRGEPRTCTLYLRYNPAKEDGLKAAIQTARKAKN